MATTIADIARITGFAKSTISRYLNGGSVSKETSKRIEEVISETGYSPNRFAQSLKAKQTKIIGTIVPRLDSFATNQTLIGIDEQLRDYDYQVLILNTSQNIQREIENIYTLQKQRVAGIILLATVITEEHIKAFNQSDIPAIIVGQEHEEIYSVIHNDYDAAYELGKVVLQKGHRRIAFLGVTEKDIAVGIRRKEGFQQAVSEYKNCDVRYYETSFKIEDAVECVPEILKDFQPSLIVCATDNIAFGALKAIQKSELTVPMDVSITGFGGYSMTEFTNPEITTVKFHYKKGGKLAAQNMVKLINQEKVPSTSIVDFEVISRESVDTKK
ncbi:LacI family DNA-binding transcriptional regulator [Bacillus massiliigorillae]|uniref:LacI family DNA-binding transcriptional regulator n=1 Tax=Bacillus massiliigorillae TaxID=1243664 RepID=UPI00039A1109|nr:LacI family DNA-binding transcriptional regulator [Bacillus massiliigorillae]